MNAIRRLALSTSALVMLTGGALATASPPQSPAKVYDTRAGANGVNCADDNACQSIFNIAIRFDVIGGVTGIDNYSWQDSATTCTSGVQFTPSGATGHFCQTPVGAPSFDSIPSLESISGVVVGAHAHVMSFYSGGVGGGGDFNARAGGPSVCDYLIHFPVAGQTGCATLDWERELNRPLTIEDGGPKGDGITDDTVALQRSINTALSYCLPINSIGGRIYFHHSAAIYIDIKRCQNLDQSVPINFNGSSLTTDVNIPGIVDLSNFFPYTPFNATTNSTTLLVPTQMNATLLGLNIGDSLVGSGIPSGTIVVSSSSAGIVMSNAATASATVPVKANSIYTARAENHNALIDMGGGVIRNTSVSNTSPGFLSLNGDRHYLKNASIVSNGPGDFGIWIATSINTLYDGSTVIFNEGFVGRDIAIGSPNPADDPQVGLIIASPLLDADAATSFDDTLIDTIKIHTRGAGTSKAEYLSGNAARVHVANLTEWLGSTSDTGAYIGAYATGGLFTNWACDAGCNAANMFTFSGGVAGFGPTNWFTITPTYSPQVQLPIPEYLNSSPRSTPSGDIDLANPANWDFYSLGVNPALGNPAAFTVAGWKANTTSWGFSITAESCQVLISGTNVINGGQSISAVYNMQSGGGTSYGGVSTVMAPMQLPGSWTTMAASFSGGVVTVTSTTAANLSAHATCSGT